MRKLLAVSVAVVAFVVLAGCQPTEPTMTITARQLTPVCLNNALIGEVTPRTATKKVVLQRTVAGKWQDWKWYDDSGPAHLIESTLSGGEGSYVLDFLDSKPGGTALSGTIHLRARSEG